MKMLKLLISILFFTSSFTQTTKPFDFDFDVAKFRFDNSSKKVEVFYSLSSKGFTKSFTQDEIFIYPKIKLNVYNSVDDNLLFSQPYVIRYKAEEGNLNYYLGILNFRAGQGKYLIKLSVSDHLDSNLTTTYETEFSITCNTSSPKISDIILGSKIVQQGDENSVFYRNGIEIYPNARNTIVESMPIGFYYAELYNLGIYGNEVKYKVEVRNPYEITVFEKNKIIKTKNNGLVQIGHFKLKDLASGKYKLLMSLFDSKDSLLSQKKKSFYYVSSVATDTTLNLENIYVKREYLASQFAIMSNDECDEVFRISRFIATENELDTYPKLIQLSKKREFLYIFWLKRDKVPETNINEYFDEYKTRAEYVDKKFKEYQRKGSETDRGRVYLVYGKPDKIDMKQNDYYNKPYHTWEYYNIEGGVYFIFGDINSLGQFKLLHSTKLGERHDANWMDRIKIR